jgi:hypothetical protein
MKITKFVIILALPLFIFSQDKNETYKNEKHKRMQSRKIAYISDNLELSPNQAELFWPMYNLYSSEMQSVLVNKKKALRNYNKNQSSMDNTELGFIIDGLLKVEKENLELKIKFLKQFSKIISNRQIIELHQSEEGFKKELLRKIKKGDKRSSDYPLSPPPRTKNEGK